MPFKIAKNHCQTAKAAVQEALKATKDLKPENDFTLEQALVIRTAFDNLNTAHQNLSQYIGKNIFKKFICLLLGGRVSNR